MYRDDLKALVDRHNALDADMVRARNERDQLRTMIDSAQARLRLPVLDNIQVASPCNVSWDSMKGDARARHCGSCNQNVYNLSEMTREEAQALLIEKEGRLCVRYYRRRQDGTVMTKDCPVGGQRRRRWWFGIGIFAALIGAIFGFLSAKKHRALALEDAIDDQRDVIQGGAMNDPGDHEVRMGEYDARSDLKR